MDVPTGKEADNAALPAFEPNNDMVAWSAAVGAKAAAYMTRPDSPFGSWYITFVNGYQKPEGKPLPEQYRCTTADEAFDALISSIREYREQMCADVISWRRIPELRFDEERGLFFASARVAVPDRRQKEA